MKRLLFIPQWDRFSTKNKQQIAIFNEPLPFSFEITMKINCPSCQKKFVIAIEEPEINWRLNCPNCQAQFEVTWLYPFTLDYLEESSYDSDQFLEKVFE
jgi:transposase-like protein